MANLPLNDMLPVAALLEAKLEGLGTYSPRLGAPTYGTAADTTTATLTLTSELKSRRAPRAAADGSMVAADGGRRRQRVDTHVFLGDHTGAAVDLSRQMAASPAGTRRRWTRTWTCT